MLSLKQYLLLSVVTPAPNIVYVMVDDWGWADWGLHGSQIDTPNIDELASLGVHMAQHYTQPLCSPTRSSFLTGRYPIRLGLQHSVILTGADAGIPRQYKLFPQHLQNCGYTTHLVGKWHCGHSREWMRPENRGFDTFYGFLTSHSDHYTKINDDDTFGVDFCEDGAPTNKTWGQYEADLYSSRVEKIILGTKKENPFFLYYSMQNVHYPLQVPEKYEQKYNWIIDEDRRMYAAMVSVMDDAIGDLVKLLKKQDLWQNTLMIVTADNGGETRYGGYNYPLRSQKFTVFEGGIRGNAFITGGLMENESGRTYHNLFHISDWYQTLLEAGECQQSPAADMDSVSHWKSLKSEITKPPRNTILHNIDPLIVAEGEETRQWVKDLAERYNYNISIQAAARIKNWKIITGDPINYLPDGHIIPPEELQLKSQLNTDCEVMDLLKSNQPHCYVKKLRKDERNLRKTYSRMVQLYRVDVDPEERIELSDKYPAIVEKGIELLSLYDKKSIEPQFPEMDPRSNPQTRTDQYAGYWWPWIFDEQSL